MSGAVIGFFFLIIPFKLSKHTLAVDIRVRRYIRACYREDHGNVLWDQAKIRYLQCADRYFAPSVVTVR